MVKTSKKGNREMKRQGRIQEGMPGMMCSMEINEISNVCQIYDDMSGKMLDPGGVEKAREEEMKVKKHEVYVKVPIQQCLEETGQAP